MADLKVDIVPSLSVFSKSLLTTEWNTVLTTNTFIAARSITAMKDNSAQSNAYSLVLGATSNVQVEAANSVNLYSGNTTQNQFNLYASTPSNDTATRTDTLYLSASTNATNNLTVLSTSTATQNLLVSFSNLVNLNSIYMNTNNSYDTIGTNKSSLVIANTTNFSSNVAIQGNSVVYGSFFASNLNMWTAKTGAVAPTDLTMVGYGFRINSNDQLELIKMSSFKDNSTGNKRVAVFGLLENAYGQNDSTANYQVLNALNPSTPGGGTGSLITSVSPLDAIISVYNNNIGINTKSAQYPLDVVGGARFSQKVYLQGGFSFTGDIVPTAGTTASLGSQSSPIQNIFCSSNVVIGSAYLKCNSQYTCLYVTDGVNNPVDIYAAGLHLQGNLDMGSNNIINVQNITSSNATIHNLNVTSTVVTAGADYAEYMEKSDVNALYEPGAIIGIDVQGKVTSVFDDSIRFMVVSSQPSIVGGYIDDSEDFAQSNVKIAYCGRVPVSLSSVVDPPIAIGSYIVPVANASGSIDSVAINASALTMTQYISAVGQVIYSSNDVPFIIVK